MSEQFPEDDMTWHYNGAGMAGKGYESEKDPRGRIGVFKSIAEVPPELRLENNVEKLEATDPWTKFTEYRLEGASQRLKRRTESVGDQWADFVEERTPHPAVATPKDIDEFFQMKFEVAQLKTVYNPYWVTLEQFFWYLYNRVEFPHLYHPVLMAAVNFPTSQRVWEHKVIGTKDK